jgi:aminoglycoside 3-N-acetyltransferase
MSEYHRGTLFEGDEAQKALDHAGGIVISLASTELTVRDLSESFGDVGISEGDSVVVHSSFRSLGPVRGGPAAVIQALLDVLGADGNLMLPTFNYRLSDRERLFDPAAIPARTGIIPETGRTWTGALRSLHPTHSVAVIGPDAEELTRDHLKGRAMGVGSPLDRLAEKNGKVLLIGVGNNTNSMIHIGEEHANVPKAPWQFGLPEIQVRLPDGRIVWHAMDTSTSCSTAFGAVEYPLRQKRLIRDFRRGATKFQLMRGTDVIEVVCDALTEQPDILLCTNAECRPCSGARKNLQEQGRIRCAFPER